MTPRRLPAVSPRRRRYSLLALAGLFLHGCDGAAPRPVVTAAAPGPTTQDVQRADPGMAQDSLRAIVAQRASAPQVRAALSQGSDQDLPGLRHLATGAADYAAESALKAMAIHGGEAARQMLLGLRQVFARQPRRLAVTEQVLREAFPDSHPDSRLGRLAP